MNKSFTIAAIILGIVLIQGCASTRTTKGVQFRPLQSDRIAVMPFAGEYGEQAADFVAEELLMNGFRVVERSRVEQVLRELNFSGDPRFDSTTLPAIGRQLGLKEVLVGSISAVGGPLYSYKHVNISLRLVDVETSDVLWVARYGNPMWSSAISTQGDIQRGARHLAREFVNAFGR